MLQDIAFLLSPNTANDKRSTSWKYSLAQSNEKPLYLRCRKIVKKMQAQTLYWIFHANISALGARLLSFPARGSSVCLLRVFCHLSSYIKENGRNELDFDEMPQARTVHGRRL